MLSVYSKKKIKKKINYLITPKSRKLDKIFKKKEIECVKSYFQKVRFKRKINNIGKDNQLVYKIKNITYKNITTFEIIR